MDGLEVNRILTILQERGRMSPKEVQLKRILSHDNNIHRINKCLEDNPDLYSIACDLLEIPE